MLKGLENMKLIDEELENVSGGVNAVSNKQAPNEFTMHDCPVCEKKTKYKLFTGGRGVCMVCGHKENGL